jgi:hypothetical protein
MFKFNVSYFKGFFKFPKDVEVSLIFQNLKFVAQSKVQIYTRGLRIIHAKFLYNVLWRK